MESESSEPSSPSTFYAYGPVDSKDDLSLGEEEPEEGTQERDLETSAEATVEIAKVTKLPVEEPSSNVLLPSPRGLRKVVSLPSQPSPKLGQSDSVDSIVNLKGCRRQPHLQRSQSDVPKKSVRFAEVLQEVAEILIEEESPTASTTMSTSELLRMSELRYMMGAFADPEPESPVKAAGDAEPASPKKTSARKLVQEKALQVEKVRPKALAASVKQGQLAKVRAKPVETQAKSSASASSTDVKMPIPAVPAVPDESGDVGGTGSKAELLQPNLGLDSFLLMMAQESVRAITSEYIGDLGGTCFTTSLLQAASEQLSQSIAPQEAMAGTLPTVQAEVVETDDTMPTEEESSKPMKRKGSLHMKKVGDSLSWARRGPEKAAAGAPRQPASTKSLEAKQGSVPAMKLEANASSLATSFASSSNEIPKQSGQLHRELKGEETGTVEKEDKTSPGEEKASADTRCEKQGGEQKAKSMAKRLEAPKSTSAAFERSLAESPPRRLGSSDEGPADLKEVFKGQVRYHRAASLPDQPSPRPRMSCLKKANTESSLEMPKILRFAPEAEIKELSPRSPCSPAFFSPTQAVVKGTPVDVDVQWLQQLGHVTLDMAEKGGPSGSTARSSSWPNEERAGGDKQLLHQHSMPVRSSNVEAVPTMQGMARRQSMLPSQFGRPEAPHSGSHGGGRHSTPGAFGGSAPAKGIEPLPHAAWSQSAGGSKQVAQGSKGVQDGRRPGGSQGDSQGQAHGQGAWPSPNPGVKHGVVNDSEASMTREVPRWFAKSEKTVQSDGSSGDRAPKVDPQCHGADCSQGTRGAATPTPEKGFMIWKQPVVLEGGSTEGTHQGTSEVSPFTALAQYLYHMVQPIKEDPGKPERIEHSMTLPSPLALAAPPLQTTVNCPNELVDASEKYHKRERHQSSPHHSSPRKHTRRRKSKKHEAFEHGGGDNSSPGPAHIVTDEMVITAQRGGLTPDLEQRVLERAYFLFINGASEDQCQNYFEALRIELGLLWGWNSAS